MSMDFHVNTETTDSISNRKCSYSPSYTNHEIETSGDEEWKVKEYWEPDDGPRQVWVTINIHSLDRIDTVNQTFETKFTVIQNWIWSKMDEELNYDLFSDKLNFKTYFEDQDVKVCWEPKPLKFPNALNDQLFIEEYGLRLKKYNELVLIEKKTNVSGRFSEKFELQSFPFDCQDFHIDIDWDDSEKSCKISPNPLTHDFVTLNVDTMVQKIFKIHEPIVETYIKPIQVVSKGMKVIYINRPSIEISLKGERLWISYFWQIFLLLFLMSAFALFAFTLDINDSGNRLNFSMTVFLTKVAFQFSISSLLPKLSYLTLLDIYVIACMVFGCSVMFQISITSWMITNETFRITSFVNNALLGFNTLILITGIVFLCIYIFHFVIPRERLKLIICEWSHTKYHIHWNPQNMKRSHEEHNIKDQILLASRNLFFSPVLKRNIFVVKSWISIKLIGKGNFAYFGENLGKELLKKFYPNNSEILKRENSDLNCFIRDRLCGLWIMRFAQIEFLAASMVIVLGRRKKVNLKFIKVAGKSGVSAGKPFMIVSGIPNFHISRPIQGKVQLQEESLKKRKWTLVDITMPKDGKISIKMKTIDSKKINIYRYKDAITVPYTFEEDSSDYEQI